MSVAPTEHRESLSSKVESVPKNDPKRFQEIVEAHRGELLAHCYRFTGSRHDAEDLVQETFLRAWRGLDRFEGRSSLRSWLYRIATNACLNAAARRKSAKRVFPEDVAASTTRMPEGQPDLEIPWIEPMPDSLLENVADASPGPAARYELRETIRLAFVAATQRLPARQRAVLLLRDVLGWSARETSDALKMSAASVNSALQRARGTIGRGLSLDDISDAAAGEGSHRSVADEYANAWERSDLSGFIALLTKDASLVMPPRSEWYSGRAAIRSFFGWAFDWAWKAGKRGAFRMIKTHANGQIAFGTYVRHVGEPKFHAHALQVLTLRNGRIGRITVFVGPRFFKNFGLPAELNPT
jgi:RNA polymerase sigma-70 factor (ECF subfamily)